MNKEITRFDHAGIFQQSKPDRHISLLFVGTLLFGACIASDTVSALTLEQAREQCRELVGRPIVQSCMRSHGYGGGRGRWWWWGQRLWPPRWRRRRWRGGGGPDKDAQREACRAQASPQVKACMEKAMNAAHGRANVPVAVPVEKTIDEPVLDATPASFVAPPRTINDITAILDGEKPDQAKIEALKAAADAKPPTGKSQQDLAWFYYTRSSARGQLGRVNDAIEDANKAIEVARGAVDANFMGRLQQLAGLQYAFAGNPKQALAIFSSQVRDTNVKGAKGHMFGGNRQVSSFLIQIGDLAQADAYLRRSAALIQEARTSGFPGWRTSYAQRGQSWEAEFEYHRAIMFEARGQFREEKIHSGWLSSAVVLRSKVC